MHDIIRFYLFDICAEPNVIVCKYNRKYLVDIVFHSFIVSRLDLSA